MAASNDMFRLDIEFAGMCMFVRDPTRKRMHVLLPNVEGHLARLFYAPEHGRGAPCQNGTTWRCESLDGVDLDLTGLGAGSSGVKPNDNGIVDLSISLGDVPVPRKHLDKPPTGDPLLCRVTLDDGLRKTSRPGITWVFNGKRRPMAVSLTWNIPRVEAPLHLDLGAKTIELSPDNQQMRLAIFNAPFDELPDSDGSFGHPTEPAHHFAGYYDLFDGITASKKKIPERPEQNIPKSLIDKHIGRRFTCIVAQAEAAS